MADLSGIVRRMNDKSRRAPVILAHHEPRFWLNVDRGEPDACWTWLPDCQRRPEFRVANGKFFASHIALALDGKPRPDGAGALHSCDNGLCCNPKHLRWGTQAENMADKKARRRSANQHGHTRNTALRNWLDQWTAF